MVRKETAQVAALLTIAVLIALRFTDIPVADVGIYPGCGFSSRFTYQLFHSGWLHVFANCWCLVCIVFSRYDVTLRMMLAAFLVAASFPVNLLSFLNQDCTPTIGLSGMCYALLGRITFQTARRFYYLGWIAAFLAIGFFFHGTNSWLHLYCLLMGILLGFLNKPMGCR